MDLPEFSAKVAHALPRGAVLKNPLRGTTRVLRASEGFVVYQRGKSTIQVALGDLYAAYCGFRGKRVSSADLRVFAPKVFDSKQGGHSCNCTMLFLLLMALGLAERIHGRGVRSDPFWIEIAP